MTSSQKILQDVDRADASFKKLSESAALHRAQPDKWSRKEILGHLIDSVANNHQRIVRAQLAGALEFPPYAQMDWVRVQAYERAAWASLVALWTAFNRHLAHVIAAVPVEKLSTPCRIGDRDPVTLEFLITDYIRHLEHHLKQIDPAL
jgi:hypothetical protein